MAIINKEERNCFLFPLPCWLDRFIPHMHLTPQGLVIVEGKNDRLVFNGSYRINAESTCVNQWTHKSNEPTLEFPQAFHNHLQRIYNLRLSYPTAEIYLWDDDVSSAFRWVKLNPDVAAIFAFRVGTHLYIPTGQTFGSNTSPSNWETLAKARRLLGEDILSRSYDYQDELRDKHAHYLTQVKRTAPRDTVPITAAVRDAHNTGVFRDKVRPPTQMNMHVDDNLLVDVEPYIDRAIAASIESIFLVLGHPQPHLRKVALS